jgi:hypothetical protein
MATTQLVLNVTDRLDRELSRLAIAGDLTKEDLIRRGLALAKVAIDEKTRGNRIGIVDEAGRVVCEIIGI